MNELIIKEIAKDLGLNASKIEVVLKLLSEGNTVPFIARYRKEATGAMDEEVIRKINEVYEYQVNLAKRKEDVIRLIDEKGMLTDELRNDILLCNKLVDVEDLYRPYKEKKKTKATEAIALGVEPFANYIMSFPMEDITSEATKYITDKVTSVEDVVMHAKYIIAERVSDVADYRKWIRAYIYKNGLIISKKKKNAVDEKSTYEMYYELSENINRIKPHRVLAMNRGENEKILSVSIDVDVIPILVYLEKSEIKNTKSSVVSIVVDAIKDSYKRLIFPSVEREIRSELKEISEDAAIVNFKDNLEKLLLTPPIKDKIVLGFDPAFRTGCKLAVLDKTGKMLETSVIYPTEPKNDIEGSEKIVRALIEKYNIEIIAIGNGTASRESEVFVANLLKKIDRRVEYIIVNEAGASVYSASKLAISEFPDLTVEKRSAISIGRRLQDALAELVKIDPKSIGVGLYQHDVTAKKLDESLDFVVVKTVNQVGVNVNTASVALLSYVSGMSKKASEALINYREENGKIESRVVLSKIKGISAKIYEQAIGFMRIIDGTDPFDKTSIHPESYKVAKLLLDVIGMSKDMIGTSELQEALKELDIASLVDKLDTDKYTLTDIVESLSSPNRDPRDKLAKPLLRSDVLELENLKIGDELQGTVRNVIDFGAFVDVGLHDDGLIHISKLSNTFIKHPSEIVSVGDIITCYVYDISLEKQKLSLSLLPLEKIKK